MCPCSMRVTYAWMENGKTRYREGYECLRYAQECKRHYDCDYAKKAGGTMKGGKNNDA